MSYKFVWTGTEYLSIALLFFISAKFQLTSKELIWEDEQCKNIGFGPSNDILQDCKNTCLEIQECNAINFNWNGCVLRACPYPIPEPISTPPNDNWFAYSVDENSGDQLRYRSMFVSYTCVDRQT